MVPTSPKGFTPKASKKRKLPHPVIIAAGSSFAGLVFCVLLAAVGYTDLDLYPIIALVILLALATAPILVIYALISSLFPSNRRENPFWKDVAESYGLTYTSTVSLKGEKALMYKQGFKHEARHVLEGELHGNPFRTFEYVFVKSNKERGDLYTFTVFEFTFAGSFPHLYLNYLNNYNPSLKIPSIPLPSEVQEKFSLYAPEQYEVEALEIFTPDTLAFLLDREWKYDLEMLDGKILVFGTPNRFSAEIFMSQLEKITSLVEHLERRLHRASFSPIGDKPYRL